MTPAQEMQILRKYATGGNVTGIAADLGIPNDKVTEVLSAIDFQIGRARELLRQHEAALTQHKAVKEATVHVEPQPDTIEQRLLRAETIPRLRARAIRIRAMLDDLGRDLEAAAEFVEAEAKVQRLRAELDKATTALRQLARPAKSSTTTKAATAAPAADEVDRAAVRRWAAEHGIECAPSGRIARSLVGQYLAAHKEVAA